MQVNTSILHTKSDKLCAVKIKNKISCSFKAVVLHEHAVHIMQWIHALPHSGRV